jgi:hypothetical protein
MDKDERRKEEVRFENNARENCRKCRRQLPYNCKRKHSYRQI